MRLKYLLILSLALSFCYASEEVPKTPRPKWVIEVGVENDDIVDGQGGYQYLLLDQQDHLPKEASYRHTVVKLLNAEGIQALSDIELVYDPSYERLELHRLLIKRDGKIIDKLQESEIKVFQREASMERSLYDGSLSAVINLTDVREGDILEYAFSITGYNPINKGHFSDINYQQFLSPVNRIHTRIVTDPDQYLKYELYDGAEEPEKVTRGGKTEYIWDIDALEFELYDNNVPSWYDSQKRVRVTTFKDWSDVVNWALPLYEYDKADVESVTDKLAKAGSEEERILELIWFVQDEVRYLGFESGIGAYKPHKPSKVYTQRYGDCKDKSLLLVSLLRQEGVEAYPMLVHTLARWSVKDKLPSNQAFNHCVVNFKYDGKDYFVDPTISGQSGGIDVLSFPDYGRGLLIKPGESDLIKIENGEKSTTKITEDIVVKSIGGSARMHVQSIFTGDRADYIRNYFSTESRESIQKEYLNFYSNLYPSIEMDKEIKMTEEDRDGGNRLIIDEYYNIKEFWQDSSDSTYVYGEVYPLVLESRLNYPKTPSGRDMPYYLGSPFSFSQVTNLKMPED